MNDQELELTPTPTPVPVTVIVESSPDTAYLSTISNTLGAHSQALTGIDSRLAAVENNTALLSDCVYLAFVLVLFELLRFVKGFKNKEVK